MKDSFNCKNKQCGKVSVLRRIEQHDGIYFVTCEHCGSKNKLISIPTPDGAPKQHKVIGLVDETP